MRIIILSLSCMLLFITCQKSKSGDEQAAPNPVNQPVGNSSRNMLAATSYASLNIEVSYMPGFRLDDKTVVALHDFMADLVNKPGGIFITQKQIASSGKNTLTLAEVDQLETQNRTVNAFGNSLGLHILVTDGGYTAASVLGIAYKATSVVLFGKTIHDNSGGLTQVSRDFLEAIVAEHEMGHLLGLVNVGSALQSPHEDSQHPNHCNNKNCLMYYATETTDILSSLTGSMPPLDAPCRADLRANGGK